MGQRTTQVLTRAQVARVLRRLGRYKELGKSPLARSSMLCALDTSLSDKEYHSLSDVVKGSRLQAGLEVMLRDRVIAEEDPERAAYYGYLWLRYFCSGLLKEKEGLWAQREWVEEKLRVLSPKVSEAMVDKVVEIFGEVSAPQRVRLQNQALDYLVADLTEIEFRYIRKHSVAHQPVGSEGQSSPGIGYIPRKPRGHVTRRLQDEVVEAVTAVGEGGQAVWRVVILYGLAGMGKTTLATAVAHDERVEEEFGDGILWVDATVGKPEQWLADFCTALQLKRERWECWADCWQRWAGEEGRRCLLVVDDAVEGKGLEPLLAELGPGVVVLVTTQQGAEVRAEVERWASPGEIRAIGVRGMEVEEGWRLVERNLERELEEDEWVVVQKIGELVGWHPESLRLAAVEGGERGWQVVLKDLESEGVGLVTVDMMLERQWRRLEEKTQERLLALVEWLNHGKCFGVRYGAVVWGVETEVAELCLEQLEGTGLVERMESERDALGWVQELWRMTPVVWRRWGSKSGNNLWQTLKWMYPRWRLYRRMDKEGWQELGAPWQYQVVNTVWSSLSIVKGIVALSLWIIGWLRQDWAWYERWMNWTTPLRAEHKLKDHWARAGIEPPEELWLIYDSMETVGFAMFILQVVGMVVLCIGGGLCLWVQIKVPALAVEPILRVWDAFALIVLSLLCTGGVWGISWRTWIAYLYGLEMWDLRLIGRAARWLGMKDVRRAIREGR